MLTEVRGRRSVGRQAVDPPNRGRPWRSLPPTATAVAQPPDQPAAPDSRTGARSRPIDHPAQGRRRDPRHRREVRRQPGHRHRLDDGPDRHVSPGRSGFGPQLSLSYDSGAGNGPFGFGWSLVAPVDHPQDRQGPAAVPRRARSRTSSSSPAPRTWCPCSTDRTATGRSTTTAASARRIAIRRYRPRIEGLFARIERWTSVERRRRPLALDLQGQRHSRCTARTTNSPHRRPRRPAPHLQLADLRDARRQGQRRRLRVQGRGRRSASTSRRRTSATAAATTRARANRYLKRIRYGNRARS